MKKVAVVMGSDSDLPVVQKAIDVLKKYEVPFEVHIFSAHRTPVEASKFSLEARENGFGVIIAAAGKAAHLAGSLAANTTLPVIGIPIKSSTLDGLDALLSTVQMPSGIPVATVEQEPRLVMNWNGKDIVYSTNKKFAKPKVLIPVFPGTNCEYDSAKAIEKAGGNAEIFVINNLSAQGITDSVKAFANKVNESQIIFIPGGFSGGDEPDGSGKFITAFFRNSEIKDAVTNLLDNRDGLICGVCNGFQALNYFK